MTRAGWLVFFCILQWYCCRAEIPQIVVTDNPGLFPNSLTFSESLFKSQTRNLLEIYWDTLYYRVSCSSRKSAEQPIISDENVNRLAPIYYRCSQLLENKVDFIVTNKNPGVSYNRLLQAMPIMNVKNEKTLTIRQASMSIEQMTSCCEQSKCPEQCIDTASPTQDCYLEVYLMILAKDFRNLDFYYGLSWYGQPVPGTLTETGVVDSLRYRILFRIKCQHCFLTNCLKECKNGQVCLL